MTTKSKATARQEAETQELRERLEAIRDWPRFSCGGESAVLANQAITALDNGDVAAAGRLALDSFASDSDREKAELAQAYNEASRQNNEVREWLAARPAAIPDLYVTPRPAAVPVPQVVPQSAATVAVENGPGKGKRFHWNGVAVKLSPLQWKLVKYLWQCKDRRAEVETVQDKVWGHEASDSTIRTMASRVSSCFAVKNIPVTLPVVDGMVTLNLP